MTANPKKPATSVDVARRAGVSQTSVSRVFNKEWDSRVSDDLREKVMRAAQELGYTPNAIARGLTSRRTGIIGVVVSEEFSVFYHQALCQLTNAIQRRNMRVMVFNIAPDNDINQIISRLTEYQVDGIIITSAALVKVVSSRWVRNGLPLVVFNAHLPSLVCSSVYGDNFTATARMAQHLYEIGCRRFAYISSGKSRYTDHLQRKEGFLSGLADMGVEDCIVLDGDFSYHSGQEAARELLTMTPRPDAIFCGGELMAFGVMDVARYEFHLQIPADIAVAGYDDSFVSSLKAYDITAVHQPLEKMVETTVNLIVEQINQPGMPARSICEPMDIIIRSSTVS